MIASSLRPSFRRLRCRSQTASKITMRLRKRKENKQNKTNVKCRRRPSQAIASPSVLTNSTLASKLSGLWATIIYFENLLLKNDIVMKTINSQCYLASYTKAGGREGRRRPASNEIYVKLYIILCFTFM